MPCIVAIPLLSLLIVQRSRKSPLQQPGKGFEWMETEGDHEVMREPLTQIWRAELIPQYSKEVIVCPVEIQCESHGISNFQGAMLKTLRRNE